MFISNRLKEDQFSAYFLGDKFNLHFSEMSCFNLDLTAGNSNNPKLWLLYSFSDFLSFSYKYLHAISPQFYHIGMVTRDIPIGI